MIFLKMKDEMRQNEKSKKKNRKMKLEIRN